MIGLLSSQTGSQDKVAGGLGLAAWVASQGQEIGACGEAVITCRRFCAARPWMRVSSEDDFALEAGIGGQRGGRSSAECEYVAVVKPFAVDSGEQEVGLRSQHGCIGDDEAVRGEKRL
ncbi:hypothetical protein ENH_00062560 [Eimeria necatrix]|uniref:Uncharacterized protein n=1 Tax=Eimeria necatrix TaxID=51315 RepID=U6N197_9EIME|nr:hypothetical protein ENH_00062560 [Eimeria necatrix]CDJ69058.1 hypothetical protein ENH_00062560 [Eimeria necatrix]